jgi:hypothetical protein
VARNRTRENKGCRRQRSGFGQKSACWDRKAAVLVSKAERKIHTQRKVWHRKAREQRGAEKMDLDEEVEPAREPVAGHPVALAVWQPAANQTLVSVLGTVAHKQRMSPIDVEQWVEAVRSKLEDIGIESV